MPKAYKTVEIVQQTKFGFTPSLLDKVLSSWSSVKDFAYIVHDKDTKTDGSLKEVHIHCMLRFTGAVPTTAIISKFGGVISENHLQKMFSWGAAIAYLTHANALGKHQYDDAEVVSNFDFTSDREKALAPIKDERLHQIVLGIDNGTIREYNYTEYITMQEYVKYAKSIKQAFQYQTERLMKDSDRGADAMEVIYIYGDAGTCKTSYAKEFCKEQGLSYFVSSSSNDVLDGYGNQDAIILDDLRPSALCLADLLKLLDNNTASKVKSRYTNKTIRLCKCIIITTTLRIDDFFSHVFSEEPETSVQLMRRCKTLMHFFKDKIDVFAWSDASRNYEYAFTTPNALAERYSKANLERLSMEEKLKWASRLCVGISDASAFLSEQLKSTYEPATENLLTLDEDETLIV